MKNIKERDQSKGYIPLRLIIRDNMKTKIIICSDQEKRKQLSSNQTIEDKKYMTYQEFCKKYYFDYQEDAIYYLMKKYQIHLDVAKDILKNMRYIEKKDYKSKKLNHLKELKEECKSFFIENPLFKEFINKNEVEVLSTFHIEKKDQEILKYNNIIPPFQWSTPVQEFPRMEDELDFVCQEIVKLKEKNISLNKIFLVNVSEDYYYSLSKMFSYYHIPIEIPFQDSIFGTKIVQDYLKDKILPEDLSNPITQKLCNVLEDFTNLEEDEISRKILIDRLKHTYFPIPKKKESVKIRELETSFEDDEYVFVLNFNQDSIPRLREDTDYLKDEEKEELGLYTSLEWNKKEKELVPYLLSKIKNLTITYKCSTPFQKFYPSTLIQDYSLEVIKKREKNYQYSPFYNQLRLGEMLDKFYLYGEKEKDLERLNSTYDISYNSYSNQFTGISREHYLEKLEVPLRLSYTALNTYNECKFKYYISNVLKLNPFEETFAGYIGSLYHKIISLYKRDTFDFETEWNAYLEKRELSLKEKILLVRIKKDLLDLIEILKHQDAFTEYKEEFLEKKVVVPLRNDIAVEFIGFIDKILYYQKLSDTYFAIIDYKSGMIDTHMEPMKYGLHMQLPIYLYLIHYGKVFDNPIFTGIYYQNILFSYPTWSNKLEQEEKKKYYLQGYSIDNPELLSKFDITYRESEWIKGLKYTEEKGFGTYSKTMTEETLYHLLQFTKKHIEEKTEEILNADFKINPKILEKENVSCEFCKFQDLCFHRNEDVVRLPKVEDLSFLGGEEE